MGKASSAKKVARLTGGGTKKHRRPVGAKYAFPMLVGGLLAAGIVGVVLLKHSQPGPFPRVNTQYAGDTGDHIHEAYGFNVCGKWLPPVPVFDDEAGLHTHGDGVIHIHPFDVNDSGRHAQLKVFLNGAGIRLTDTQLFIPQTAAGGQAISVHSGGDCNGKKAVLRVAEWDHAVNPKTNQPVTSPPTKVYKKGFGNLWLGHDGGALTIYYGPSTDKIPFPDTDGNINYLIQARGGKDVNVGTPAGGSGGNGSSNAPGAPGLPGAPTSPPAP